MVCKNCGKNNAEIYYKQTINGKTVEYALCTQCAEKLKKEGKLDIKIPSFFDDFGFGISNNGLYGIEELFGLPASSKNARRSEKKTCTLCSSTFDDLVKNGRVGCAKCYEVFADELRHSIESIHGKSEYIGRTPEKCKEKETKEDKINTLKAELDSAIAEQEFEKAAVLRDEIRALENSAEENREKEG